MHCIFPATDGQQTAAHWKRLTSLSGTVCGSYGLPLPVEHIVVLESKHFEIVNCSIMLYQNYTIIGNTPFYLTVLSRSDCIRFCIFIQVLACYQYSIYQYINISAYYNIVLRPCTQ